MEKRRPPKRTVKRKARTEEVLGSKPRERRVPAKWREHYKHLVELRDRLRNQQTDLAKDALEEKPNFSTHLADAGTDTYDRDLALSMLSSEQEAVYEIEEALDRIRNGNYGTCEITGKPIEVSRLDAIPWTRFSSAAERQLERSGAVKQARLGQRETVTGAGPNDSDKS